MGKGGDASAAFRGPMKLVGDKSEKITWSEVKKHVSYRGIPCVSPIIALDNMDLSFICVASIPCVLPIIAFDNIDLSLISFICVRIYIDHTRGCLGSLPK